MLQSTLRLMINQTAYAVSTDETRPILNGIYFASGVGVFRLVATDTHRLTVRTENVESAIDGISAIVPPEATKEILQILQGSKKATVKIDIGEKVARFQTEQVTLTTRLIEGVYPGYQRVIPTEYTARLTIQAKDLRAALSRARIIARESTAINRVMLSTAGNKLIITAGANYYGEVREEIEVGIEIAEDRNVDVAFNVNYLLETLQTIRSESVYLEVTSPDCPAVIGPVEGDDYLVMIMPMLVT